MTSWAVWSNEDIAASAQRLLTRLIGNVMRRARDFGWSTNLVYQGGVALNCLANRRLGTFFENIWIMPNPGDAGSSLGAAALAYGKRLHWRNAYLGHNITGPYPVDDLVRSLLDTGIVGVANGRAEFGPRALGNRSLLADPRGTEIKDRVNEIKRRQNSDPSPLSYWLNWLMITLTSSLGGILTIICSQSLVAVNLMFTLLYVMLMAPVEYKRWRRTDQE
jgi:predicted NodU family carbamoyl transferase